tara:strand:- start:533 stop:1834 length:1302 start_codon:yes stop_codon:yes gene_type:complete
MADKKISELAALSTADVADVVPIVDVSEGVTHKITKQNLLSGHQHTLSDITDSGTAAALDVPSSGDASTSEVVKGNDTRLTDARTPHSHNHSAAAINAGVLGITYGGTGLSSLGGAGQVLKVNSTGTALEYASDNTGGGDGGGGSGEANQNAWSNFTVGSDTVSASTTTDTATFSTGTTALTISADTSTDTIQWGLSIGTASDTVAAGDHTHTLSTSAAGLAAQLPAQDGTQTTKFLDGSNNWSVPPNTTYSNFTGDSGSGGAAGLVPAPGSGDAEAGKYLDADGTFTTPPDTTYTAATDGGLTLSTTAFSLNLAEKNAWTGPQRSAFYTDYADDTTTFYMNTAQNWTWTVTSSGASGVTFELESGTTALTNANGQSGYILLTNSAGAITLNATVTDAHADVLTTISSATGTFLINYICDGSKVYLTNSKALT